MLHFSRSVTLLAVTLAISGHVFAVSVHEAPPFDYQTNKIRGVNLGGWLVLEPWITPSLFTQFDKKPVSQQGVDEYTFCKYLGKEEANRQLRTHWDSWVTEEDIRKLASYNINHLRIPVGHWALDIAADEPYVSGAFAYMVKAVGWAKRYNLKVIIDVHGQPGSQNGFDNSGIRGDVNWQKKEENLRRSLSVVKRLAAFFSHPQFHNVVTMIQPVNEPANWALDKTKIRQFYDQAQTAITSTNADFKMDIHDAFLPLAEWTSLRNPNWNRTFLDTHIYHVFDVALQTKSEEQHIDLACTHKREVATSQANLPTMVGEWSLATNDCTKWLNGYGRGARFNGTYITTAPVCPSCSCIGDADYANFSTHYKQWLRRFAETQMDAYEAGSGWIFWNFKAEQSPQWDYMLGVEQGWIPIDHSKRTSTC
ncbi:hypothetical protein H4R33_000359 [Dimargaris cristalligena]|uniref:glucan 1,3-beta-glucosidase n=1 Tax=Dimargaris cristalligena TaxID=215637 RepID=A0A4P9ZTV6_9FUNG|nr:hypothetical protein H4R33_000359 [Dimargaris cristalligena]RKP36281.1 exo-beta-1,3-glucanase [Dimargaris cristalligena]|eukprot:RKP36281.1 exo-beta-1,3-glucanase [Dimargaris cristalligena]